MGHTHGSFVFAAVVVAACAIYFCHLPPTATRITAPDNFAIPSWAGQHSRVDDISFALFDPALSRNPVIIQNSPASQWQALSKWEDLAYLSNFDEVLNTRYTVDNSSLFQYGSSGIEVKSMTLRDFFRETAAIYLSHSWTDGLQLAFDNDVQPRDFMHRLEPSSAKTNVWASAPGIIAGTHYDTTHNMFAQIRGCKRFVIHPPSSARYMTVFSIHDALDRQVQLEGRDTPQTPLGDLQTFVADLGPGDVLYLPAFFFHRVAAFPCTAAEKEPGTVASSSISISMNVWTPSKAEWIMHQLMSPSTIPSIFSSHELDPADQIGLSAIFLRMLVREIAIVDVGTFMEGVGKRVANELPFETGKCPKTSLARHETEFCHGFHAGDGCATLRRDAAKIAGFVSVCRHKRKTDECPSYSGFDDVEIEDSVVEIILGDFIEYFAATRVGSMEMMKHFLRCVAMP
jgi:hypothetical protein